METRDKILKAAYELYSRFGIRSVSMDDIAKELGMSKKTIYKHFSNKADIVYAITVAYFKSEKIESDKIHDEAKNAIAEVILFMEMTSRHMTQISPTMIYDLQKYYPRSWKLFVEHKNNYMRRIIRESLVNGIEQGLFRDNINVDLMAKVRVEQIELTLNQEIFPGAKYDMTEVQLALLDLFVHGLVTDKGRTLYYEYMKKQSQV